MAVGPWARPLDCPIGSVAPQLLCTPGAQHAACPTRLCGVRKGKAQLFSYLCSSPAVLMHHLFATALPAPSPALSQDPSCTGQGKKRGEPPAGGGFAGVVVCPGTGTVAEDFCRGKQSPGAPTVSLPGGCRAAQEGPGTAEPSAGFFSVPAGVGAAAVALQPSAAAVRPVPKVSSCLGWQSFIQTLQESQCWGQGPVPGIWSPWPCCWPCAWGGAWPCDPPAAGQEWTHRGRAESSGLGALRGPAGRCDRAAPPLVPGQPRDRVRPGEGSVPSLPEGGAGGGGTAAGQEGHAGLGPVPQHRAAAAARGSTCPGPGVQLEAPATPPVPTAKALERGVVRTAPWFTGPELGLQGPILPPPVEPSLPSPTSTALSLGGSKHGATRSERLRRGLAGTTGQRRGLQLLSLLLLLQLSLHPPHASSSARCPAHGPPPTQQRGPASSTAAPSVPLAGVQASPPLRVGVLAWRGLLYAAALRRAGALRSSHAAGERRCRLLYPEPLIHGSLLDAEEHVCFCFSTFVHSPPEVCGSVSPSSFCELKELEKMVSEVKDVLFSEN